MAPLPDSPDDPNDHYDAGAPLDGGASPAVLAGNDKHYSPSGLEIGVITAVIVIVVLSLVGLFVWRSRKNRAAQMNETASNPDTTIPVDEHLFRPVESQDSREVMPPPKFEMSVTSQEQQLHQAQQQPLPSPGATRSSRRSGRKGDSVEEYEIGPRF